MCSLPSPAAGWNGGSSGRSWRRRTSRRAACSSSGSRSAASGPTTLFAIVSEPDAAYTLLRVQLVVLSGLALTGIVAVWRRRDRRPLRRPVALLVDAFALGLVMVAFLYLSAAFGGLSGQLAFETIRRATFFVFGLAPLAFLYGLLHARLARSAVAELLVELRRKPDARRRPRRAGPRAARPFARHSPTGCRSSRPGPTWTAGRSTSPTSRPAARRRCSNPTGSTWRR